MDTGSVSALVGLAFVYGLLHALDADHIMAVSGLYGARPGTGVVRLCFNWALGHGLILLLTGICVYILGYALPPRFSEIAEYMVGGLLVIVGLGIARDLMSKKAQLHFHQHEGLEAHAHWYLPGAGENSHQHKRDHRALLIGTVHGGAGAAPMLALFSLAQTKSPWMLVAYISIYVLGILFAMLIFGGAIGLIMKRLLKYGDRMMHIMRSTAATGSVMMGLFMLRGLLPGHGI